MYNDPIIKKVNQTENVMEQYKTYQVNTTDAINDDVVSQINCYANVNIKRLGIKKYEFVVDGLHDIKTLLKIFNIHWRNINEQQQTIKSSDILKSKISAEMVDDAIETMASPIKYTRIKRDGKLHFVKDDVMHTVKCRLSQGVFGGRELTLLSDHVYDINKNKLIKYREHPEGSRGWTHMENMIQAEFNTFEITHKLEKI